MSRRTVITYEEYNLYFGLSGNYVTNSMKGSDNVVRNKIFNQKVTIKPGTPEIHFENCEFNCEVIIGTGAINEFEPSDPAAKVALEQMKKDKLTDEEFLKWELEQFRKSKKINIISKNLTFSLGCDFKMKLVCSNMIFKKKFRLHGSFLNNVSFVNTTFEDLADFWSTTFKKPTTFYKTNFNSTAVFSMATFEENVLFTYSLLAGKSIFSKTEFKKGLDLSQAIISGDLKLFDIHFENDEFQTKYFKRSEKAAYQDAIDNRHIIPTENKAHTFQILRKAYEDVGNYDDATKMRKAEKAALRELNYEKLGLGKIIEIQVPKAENKLISWFKEPYRASQLINWNELKSNDGLILYLNRRSNIYRTSFWTGVWFTARLAMFFATLTLLSTFSFYETFCFSCEFSRELFFEKFSDGVAFLFRFLNPVRRVDYLDELNPILGIAYIWDFLGRIFVGYGIYQTIQAFRKFK